METLGHVGELVYQEELHSPDVAATLRHIEGSSAFQRAVAARDPVATRDAIVGFFREHIHVVRVRVMTGAGLLVDVGGPYVLAPVHGTVRSRRAQWSAGSRWRSRTTRAISSSLTCSPGPKC